MRIGFLAHAVQAAVRQHPGAGLDASDYKRTAGNRSDARLEKSKSPKAFNWVTRSELPRYFGA
jgi:hypothetical protein